MPTDITHTGSFSANDDQGRSQTLDVSTHFHRTRHDLIPGVSSIRTWDGKYVKRLTKGKYKIVETDLLLHSDDPQAP
jgi:hypothetical protein